MAGMGPLPKDPAQRRRRNAPAGTVRLPRAGRPGPAPEWPLSGKPPTVWFEVWRTPQAVEWERQGHERVVARYCRVLVQAEKTTASAAVLAEVRQMEDRLGLSAMSMLRLKWEIVDDAAPAAAEGDASVSHLDDYRDL
jgi:hypothetical protein